MGGYKFFLGAAVLFLISTFKGIKAQNGDQILDGIGESGMISRYVFDGDIKDWSRNNLHGEYHGENANYVSDDLFGSVLSISNDDKAFISLPNRTLAGEESITVTGWIYLRSGKTGQRFFDFGRNEGSHFFVAPMGVSENGNFRAELRSSRDQVYSVQAPAVKAFKWNHLAVVFDASGKSLSLYLNGTQMNVTKNVDVDLAKLFDHSASNNELYIGKSLVGDQGHLNAKLHDFRIYRIPLTENQISGIYRNALNNDEVTVREDKEKEPELPFFDQGYPQLYTGYLSGVAEVKVETSTGVLPRLPRFIDGNYKNGLKGPKVRVLWPAPADNSQVQTPGQYTVTGRISGSEFEPVALVTVRDDMSPNVPQRKLAPFELSEVTLKSDVQGHTTKFVENRDKFTETLAQTNPDSFLYMFRNAFGQEQPEGAVPLGVWDTQETKLRGHATGHYLTAIAQAYAGTGYDKSLQDNFKEKMEYLVNTLFDLSQMSGKAQKNLGPHIADPLNVPPGPGKSDYDSDLSEDGIRTDYWNWGTGYISAYPPDQFIMLENGATYGGQTTQIWAPYYTLHKILAGLMDVYEVSGNEKALQIVKGMGSWVHSRLSQLPTESLIMMWNRYIAGEFGGMNEAMARLYRITKEQKYLETARLFDNIKMFYGDADHSHGLAKNVDTFRGLHANQHIPQIMGALEIYGDTQAPEYYHIADNFWYKTTHDYMYSIGGVAGARNPANAECFTAQPSTIYENGFSTGGQNETCATYNLLKLTRTLYMYDPVAEYMDYYERGLYNHILASVAEDSPANTYHVPLLPGSVKHFSNPDMTGFTCCNGTAIESSTKLQNSIYFKSLDKKELYVNLYVPSTLDWKEKNMGIELETSFPHGDYSQLVVSGTGQLDLKLRVPRWASKGVMVKINGQREKVNPEPGSYITLSRQWNDGDTVELNLPFQFHLEPVMDQQNIASLFYGPILLVAQESGPRKDWRKVNLDLHDISKSIKGDPATLEFTIDGIQFKPFYDTFGRHSVYLDVTLK